MADYYGNNGGGSLGTIPDLTDPNLTTRLADAVVPDYSAHLGKLVAADEATRKLRAVGTLKEQLELEKAQRAAELAGVKAKQLEADSFLRKYSDPEYIAAIAAENAAKHREALQKNADAMTESKRRDALLAAVRAAGVEPDYEYAEATESGTQDYDWERMQRDLPILQGRHAQRGVPGVDAAGNPVYPRASIDAPEPAPAENPAAEESEAPATGEPIKIRPIELSTGPVQLPAATGGALSSVPAPGSAAPAAVAVAGPKGTVAATPDVVAAVTPAAPLAIVPKDLQVDPRFVPSMMQEYGKEATKLRLENFKKTGVMLNPSQGEVFKGLGLQSKEETFLDPKTQNSYTAFVTRDGLGRIWRAPENPVLKERSKAQIETDTEMAKDLQEDLLSGGISRDKNDIASVDEAIKILGDGSTNVSGALLGLLPEEYRALVLSDKGQKVPQLLRSVVQRHLKELFGGRISNLEVKNAMELVFNPRMSEENNLATAQQLRTNLFNALQSKRDSLKYFVEHGGTMSGYEPKSIHESLPQTPQSNKAAPAPPRAGEVGGYGGRVYQRVYNPETKVYDWKVVAAPTAKAAP